MHFRAPLRDGQVASRSPLRTVLGDRKGHSGDEAQFSCLQFAESDQHAGSFRIRCGDERSITPLFLEFLNRRNKKPLKSNKSQRFFALFGHSVRFVDKKDVAVQLLFIAVFSIYSFPGPKILEIPHFMTLKRKMRL